MLAAIAATLCACENSDDIKIEPQPVETKCLYEVTGGKLTPEAAALDLASTLRAMGDDSRAAKVSSMKLPVSVTRADFMEAQSAIMRAPQQGEAITDGSDTLLYLFNFGNGEGYAVMSADASLGGDNLIALASNGTVSVDDIVNPDTTNPENPFLYMPGLMSAPGGPTVGGGPSTDITNPGGGLGYGQIGGMGNLGHTPSNLKYGEWEEYSEYGPLTSVKYHQDSPFGDLCPNKVAGCGSIALLTMFSYHESPSSIGGVYGDWSRLKDIEKDSTYISQIMPKWVKSINDKLIVVYHDESTTAINTQMAIALRAYGYKNVLGVVGMKEDKVQSYIKGNRPLVCGSSTPDFHGHYWVLDGVMTQRRPTWYIQSDGTPSSITYEYRDLIHCNWGWEGTANGYYKFRAFNPKTERIVRDDGEPVYSESRDYGYTFVAFKYSK